LAASLHPTDQLIRALVASGRPATDEEAELIVERLATAPFDQRPVPVPLKLRGINYRGQVLGARASSLTVHLVKRVVEERQ
jgi:hypothetical protein